MTNTIIRTEQLETATVYSNVRDPSGFIDWTAVLSFVDGTRTFYITGAHNIYINGLLKIKTTDSIVITNVIGVHWIYYNASNVLSESTSEPAFYLPFVATIYWDGTKGILGEERHGINFPWTVHEYLHETVGSRYIGGLAGTFTDTTISIAAGSFVDEDIEHTFALALTTCNVFYKNGSADFTWDGAQAAPYKTNAGTIRYNNGNALADVPVSNHVAYWVFATNDIDTPLMVLMGQRVDVTIANARINNKYEDLVFAQLPYRECKILYRVIFQNVGGTPTYIEAQDLRAVNNMASGTYVATSHNLLSDLQLVGTGVQFGHVSDSADTFFGAKTFDQTVKVDGADSQLVTGSHINFFTSVSATHPMSQLLNWTADYVAHGFDCYFDGANWKSSDAGSNFVILKTDDRFNIKYAAAVPVGNTITWGDGFTVAYDGYLGVHNASPFYTLTVGNGIYAEDAWIAVHAAATEDVGYRWQVGGFATYWKHYVPLGTSQLNLGHEFGTDITVDTWYNGGSNVKPYQPYFNTYRNGDVANVIGGSAWYQIPFNNERIDRRADFNNATGVYTARNTGVHLLATGVDIWGLVDTNTTLIVRIITSNKNYRIAYNNPWQMHSLDGVSAVISTGCLPADMDAGDTAYVYVYCTGGATVDLGGSSDERTWFCGCLLF